MSYLEELSKLENKAKLKLNAQERELFKNDLKYFKEALSKFSKLDLKHTKEQFLPFEIFGKNLANDNLAQNINWNFLKKQKDNLKDGYIYLKIDNKKYE